MSQLMNGERRRCTACGKPFIGADTGKPGSAPIELEPSDNGNVLLQQQVAGVAAFTFNKEEAEALRKKGVQLRLNHFAGCPHADRFRPTTTTPQPEGTGT